MWSSEVTIQFLKEYQANPCLWDVTSNEYKNEQLRENAYDIISKAVNIEGFDSAAVKAKVRSIRNIYSLERNKIIKSKKNRSKSEEIYKPKITWYPLADRILHDVIQLRESHSTELLEYPDNYGKKMHLNKTESASEMLDTKTLSLTHLGTSKKIINYRKSDPVNVSKQVTNNLFRKPATIIPPKRPKASKHNNTEKITKEIHQKITEQLNNSSGDNEFDCFSKTIACQLKQLPENVALETMACIQSYIVHQRLKVVTSNNRGIHLCHSSAVNM